MPTQFRGVPGTYVGQSATPRNIFTSYVKPTFAPTFYQIDGTASRDPDNTGSISLLRAGLLLGKETATGLYANSIIGLTNGNYTAGATTLTLTPQAATEVIRRIGATGSFTLVGPPVSGDTVQTYTVAYSAGNGTSGAMTITALPAVNQIELLTVTAGNGTGNYTLGYEGQYTGNIAYNGNATTIQSALVTLFNARGQGSGWITPTVAGTNPWTITLNGTVPGQQFSELTYVNSMGGNSTMSIVDVTATTTQVVVGSLVMPTDGSQVPKIPLVTEYGVDVTDINGNSINQRVDFYPLSGDFLTANLINFTTCDAGCQAYLKQQLRAVGQFFTFDNDR